MDLVAATDHGQRTVVPVLNGTKSQSCWRPGSQPVFLGIRPGTEEGVTHGSTRRHGFPTIRRRMTWILAEITDLGPKLAKSCLGNHWGLK